MNIYKSKHHRKIYENHYGCIPKDKNGRSYEIHHIDGNHKNNNITNLKAVTIEEHYNIHKEQGDWAACLIMSQRMKISPTEKSILSRETNRKRIANGTHQFKNSTWQRENQLKRVNNRTHHLLGGKLQRKHVADQKHHFLGGKIQSNTQLKLLANGNHISQKFQVCEHCGREFNLGNYKNWHGDNCKLKAG